MKDWRFWFAEQRGTLAGNRHLHRDVRDLFRQPSGGLHAPNVVQTAANKGVLLAFVAMAQALVVITAGIDLSVGMIFVLTNCLASMLVVGSPLEVTLWHRRRAARGGPVRRHQRGRCHLWPAAADRRDHRHGRHLLSASRLALRPLPGRQCRRDAGRSAHRPGLLASFRRASWR